MKAAMLNPVAVASSEACEQPTQAKFQLLPRP